jgi:uncharacterized membrane protein
MTEKTYTERIKVAGDQILSVVRTVIHEGNVRRLIIRNEDDRVLIEIPVTFGVVGVLVAPVAAALGAIAALVTHCTIEIERVGEPPRAAASGEKPAGEAAASEQPAEEAAASEQPAEETAGAAADAT